MSTALTARIEILPAIAAPPRLSGSLAYYVGGDRLIDGDVHPVHGSPGQRDIAEARRRLPEMEHICRPPTAGLIAAWCKKLSPSLPKAPVTPEEQRGVIEGLLLACGDLPFAVWTAETAAEALRTLEWWPPPAKVRAILLPFALRLTRVRDGLRRVVAQAALSPEPGSAVAEPADAAKEHVASIVSAFISERSFNDPGRVEERQQTKPLLLSQGALLAEYDRLASEGGPFATASAARAAMLRKQIADSEDRF